MSILDIFRHKEKKTSKNEVVKKKRSFTGAKISRFTNWISSTLNKINADINADLITTITRCRDLAKNEPIIRAYLSACVKNIIGKTGFTLQCQIKLNDHELNEKLNDEIEWLYFLWGKTSSGFLTMDGGMRT